MKKCLFLSVLFAAGFALTAVSQTSESKPGGGLYVSPGVSFLMFQGDQPSHDAFMPTVRVGHDLTDVLSVELGIAEGWLSDRKDLKPAAVYGVSQAYDVWADLLFHFTRWERFDPYVSIGVQEFWAMNNALPGNKDSMFGPRVGLGAMYHLTDNLSLRAGGNLMTESFRPHRDSAFAMVDVGLVYRFGGCSHQAAPIPAAAVAPTPSMQALTQEVEKYHATPNAPLPDDLVLVTLEMNFAYDVSIIDQKYHTQLDAIAQVLLNHPEASALIEGHADQKTGSDKAYNQKLSVLRANETYNYLVGRGIDPARLQAVGYGFSRPKVKPDLVNGNPENRRVEIYINNVGGTKAGEAEYQKNLKK